MVYKPGLYSNNQSIVVGANYDSSGQRNNGSGTALLLETARGLKDIPTNHNIYFVAYANGAKPAGKSISSGACVHASTLSGSIGATNILGMINLEPQKLDAGGERKQPGPESSREAVLFTTTPHGKKFAGQCAAPFAKSWEQAPTTFHREPSALTGNDRHYAVLGIPTVSCRSKYPVTDARTEEYVQALTDMIHQVADNDAPEPAKTPARARKHPDVSLSPRYRDSFLLPWPPPSISTGMKERATSAITIGIQLSEYLCIRNEVREGPASVPRE